MKNTAGIFITGTDTGVGKTYVARGIAEAFALKGIDVGVMKPAETGCRMRGQRLVPQDALSLMRAAGVTDALDLVNPYRFSQPLAPSVAAELDGTRIAPSKIVRAFGILARRHDLMIVEGAGGILVPLSRKYTFLDLAQILRLPILIVSRPGLGTINHTLLTISALKSRKIRIAGVVINYAEAWKTGIAEKTNPAEIEAASGVRVLGIVRHGSGCFDVIADAIMKAPR